MRAAFTILILIISTFGCQTLTRGIGSATRINSAGGEFYLTGVFNESPFEARISVEPLSPDRAEGAAPVCPVVYIETHGVITRGAIPLDEAGIRVHERCFEEFGRLSVTFSDYAPDMTGTRIETAGGVGFITGVAFGIRFEIRIIAAALDVVGTDKQAAICPVAYIQILGIVVRGTLPLDEAGIAIDERCFESFGRLGLHPPTYSYTPETQPD